MYFEICSGELDTNMDDDSSDDSDSIIEENSDEEIAPIATTPTATTTRSIDDMKIDGYENNGQPRNGIVNHNNNNNNNNMKKWYDVGSKSLLVFVISTYRWKRDHIPTSHHNLLQDVETWITWSIKQ